VAADEGLAMMRDRPVAAQKRLSQAVRAGVVGPRAAKVREAVKALADTLQLSSRRHPDDTYSRAYQVASGDTLIGIGQRHLIPYQLVMKLNRLSTTDIMAGQTLKVIQGPVHIEILKGRKELQAWLGEVCLRVYPVGIGAEDSTPEGTFNVTNKIKDPPYQPQHKPKSEFRSSGAPDNPLGSRWIDIGNHYGIHGTIEPESIGSEVSEGCIRLHNTDVEELYRMVVVGASKVIIRP
jgi:LysM repeat protein